MISSKSLDASGTMEACLRPPPHALVVPAGLVGHINPSLLLARSLVSLGFSVSFVYFSSDFLHLSQQQKCLPPHPNSHISFHVLDDGKHLPIPHPFAALLFTPEMRLNLDTLIRTLRENGHGITCLLSDSFMHWTQDVADGEGIPRVEFWASNAINHYMLCNVGLLYDTGVFPEKGSSPTEWRADPPLMIQIGELPPFPSTRYMKELRFGTTTSEVSEFYRKVGESSKRAERTLIQTMGEMEEEVFRVYEGMGRKVYAIGTLRDKEDEEEVQEEGQEVKEQEQEKQEVQEQEEEEEKNQKECMAWLEGKEEGSVVYVAFGSLLANLKEEDFEELALGLEDSGFPYLWALPLSARSPSFVRTNVNRGLIVDWVPQRQVLSHPSIGAFLSHCGWNSILDSISSSIPLICCPFAFDQRANAEFVCDTLKIGIELPRTPTGGLHRTMVHSAIQCLMQPRGEDDVVNRDVRSRVKDLMLLAKKTGQDDGRSMANLRKFYNDMKARTL